MEFADLILTPKVDGVTLHSPFIDKVVGTLCITGHHLILSSRKDMVQELWLLHQVIDCVERSPKMENNVLLGGDLTLKCKDLRVIQLEIKGPQEFLNIANSIEQLSRLQGCQYYYPFFYRPMYSILEDGYTMFRAELEYSKLLASDEWRFSVVNKDYSVCSSYAAKILVPKSISDEEIIQSAAWRDGGRFPMLSYRHDNGVSCVHNSLVHGGGAPLWRV